VHGWASKGLHTPQYIGCIYWYSHSQGIYIFSFSPEILKNNKYGEMPSMNMTMTSHNKKTK
jgi:hypothetical protein